MTATTIPVTAIEITGAPALDPIRVITQDLGPGQGRIIIECYGKAWGSYWPSMGDRNIRKFVSECDPGYLEIQLHQGANISKGNRAYLTRIITAIQETFRQSIV